MNSDEKAFTSQFELEGEENVRQNITIGGYSAKGNYYAEEWLNVKSAARKAQTQEARNFNEHQMHAAEIANLLANNQAQLAKEANRLSKWAIIISIVSCVLAGIAILKDRLKF